MDFAAPQWFWALLAAPLVILLVALSWRRRLRSIAVWSARSLWDRLLPTYEPSRLVLWNLLLAVAFIGSVLTLARPRWGETEQKVERQGVDLVFVLDTSLSMATRDIQPSRLWVGQTLIRRLVQELPGNRVALVQAEGDGVVMVPLTADGAVVDLLLDAVQPGSLPTPGTELSPAIERALDLFPEGGDKHRSIILISDGENHGSGLDKVLGRLREEGVIVHAIGVGTRQGKPLELPQLDRNSPVEYKRDEAGNVVVSRLMEDTLEQLSRDTGGIYLRATSAATDPGPVISRIQAMEKRSYGSEWVSTLEERFQWPAAVALLALVLHLLISPFGPKPAPETEVQK